MNRKTMNKTAAGLGGIIAVAGLLVGTSIASAQSDDVADEPTTEQTTDTETTDEGSQSPWEGFGEWSEGESPFGAEGFSGFPGFDGAARPDFENFDFENFDFEGMNFGSTDFGSREFGSADFEFGDFAGREFGPFGDSEGLAKTLGLTADELASAFESGQTLPEIAEANGVGLGDTFAEHFSGAGSSRWASKFSQENS